MTDGIALTQTGAAALGPDTLTDITRQMAGAIRRAWGRGPRTTTAQWAGPNILLVLLEDAHTEQEKTLHKAGQASQVLDGRRLLHERLEEDLKAIVQRATGRMVAAVLSATRLDPDLSAEIFLLERTRGMSREPPITGRAAEASARSRELVEQAEALHAQAHQAQLRTAARRGEQSAMSSNPSTSELVILGAPILLRDGSRVRIRQGRSSDQDLLRRGFERLSPKSRYRRFLAPTPELSEEMVRYLTEIDHHDHEAMIAIDDETGEGIGVARYVRDSERPDFAEVAVTVIDDWQGRGLGTLLIEVLSGRAREEGIRTFTALVLAANDEMLDILKRLATVRIVDRELGRTEVEVPIPEVGLAPALRKVLQIAAREDVAVPLAGRHQAPRAAGGDRSDS